jgi:transposase
MFGQYRYMLKSELRGYLEHSHYILGYDLGEIADKLGCSKATASRLFKKFNIKIRRNNAAYIPYERYGFNSLEELAAVIIQCRQEGMSKSELAKHIGCTRQTMIRLCKRFGC